MSKIANDRQKVLVANLCFANVNLKVFRVLKEGTVLGIGKGGFQTANTGSATAVLIWKDITANCGNTLGLRIFQISAEGSLLSVKQLISQNL